MQIIYTSVGKVAAAVGTLPLAAHQVAMQVKKAKIGVLSESHAFSALYPTRKGQSLRLNLFQC